MDVEENYANGKKGIKKAKIEAALGGKDVVMIYSGFISYVSNRRIEYSEYNVNTYKRCAGAIVIVVVAILALEKT